MIQLAKLAATGNAALSPTTFLVLVVGATFLGLAFALVGLSITNRPGGTAQGTVGGGR